MKNPLLTAVELTPADAELFRRFREHQRTFAELLESGVFETRNGQALLSFNQDGTLMTIEVSQTIFRRKRQDGLTGTPKRA